MNVTTRFLLVTIVCGVVAWNTSTDAQSIEERSAALDRTSSAVVREYVPARFVSVRVPSNLDVPGVYRNLIEAMLRRSPTFRRQCMRIAAEPRLMVNVEVSPQSLGSGIRAITHIRRTRDGGFTADVHIKSSDDEVELLSHELEHVIEQLDLIDLRSKASLADTGVHRMAVDTALFETTRATRTGLKVAWEMRGSARGTD